MREGGSQREADGRGGKEGRKEEAELGFVCAASLTGGISPPLLKFK